MSQSSARTWYVRREGMTTGGRAISYEQLAEGIEEGVWGDADEVRSSAETTWHPIGEHATTEALLPVRNFFGRDRSEEDAEADMTPMIDVTFQLVIFFMIAATYTVQKTLDVPKADQQLDQPAVRSLEELKNEMLFAKISADGKVTIGEEQVALDQIEVELRKQMEENEDVELLLDVDDETRHDVVVKVLDAAGGAQIEKVMFVSRPEPAAGAAPGS